jgi:hypothetical protein
LLPLLSSSASSALPGPEFDGLLGRTGTWGFGSATAGGGDAAGSGAAAVTWPGPDAAAGARCASGALTGAGAATGLEVEGRVACGTVAWGS